VLVIEIHLLHNAVVECRFLLTPLRHLRVLDNLHILVDVVQGLLLGKQGLELAGAIFEDLDLSEVAVLLEGLAEGLLEPVGLLAISLVHLDLEVNGLVLICETQR